MIRLMSTGANNEIHTPLCVGTVVTRAEAEASLATGETYATWAEDEDGSVCMNGWGGWMWQLPEGEGLEAS